MQRRLVVPVAAAAALAALTGGCSQSTDGDGGTTNGNAETGLCAMVSIEELVEGGYLETDEPVTVTKRLDGSLLLQDVYDVCEYGTDDQTGVTVQFNFGRPDLTLRQLVHAFQEEGQDLTLANGDKAVFFDSGRQVGIAVNHGDTQFSVMWKRLDSTETGSKSADDMRRLAETVAGRLPSGFVPADRDTPAECEGLEAAAVAVIGEFGAARGSVDGGHLICDFVGSDGMLRAKATKESVSYLENRVESLVEVGGTRKTPIADDAVTTVSKMGEMRVEGVLENCCTVLIETALSSSPAALQKSRDESLNDQDRGFINGFLAAARKWSE